MSKAIWSVTGRVWDAATRSHSKLETVDFERRVDAEGFMSFNRDWIKGMVMDRNAEARQQDGAVATSVQSLKGEGRYRTAGQLAALTGAPKAYGCHYGMSSSRSLAIREFNQGWDEIESLFAGEEV